MNYRLSQIAAITGGRFQGVDCVARSVVTDSRSLSCELGAAPLFVAMHGAHHDSHLFIEQMYRRGVRAFLTERPVELASDMGCVVVRNAIEALQQLAAYHRAHFHGVVVGITGSNGKTVIKEWIAEELPSTVSFYRSPKSYNSQLGVPLSVLMLEGDEELAIFEAGISEPGEMERLERIIRPEVVIFTSLGDAHQEFFSSMDEKAFEKLILARSAQKIIYHSHYTRLAQLIESRFSQRAHLIDASTVTPPEMELVGGEASRRNGQIVEAFLLAMGWPGPSFSAVPKLAMRLEVKEGIGGSLVVNDAYNLDLNSLSMALDYLHEVAVGRERVVILSDIVQSHLSDGELYGRVAEMLRRAGVSRLVGIGSHIARYGELFDCQKEFYLSTDDCIARLDRSGLGGKALLIKGARHYRFEKLAHALSQKSHTTRLEVDLEAMRQNLNAFRSHLREGVGVVAMVKASSYGAGNFEVARMLQHEGVEYLAVAFADEGVELRERGITMPIVVLNADQESFEQMVSYRLEPEIYSLHALESFVAAAEQGGVKSYPIHLKLDTGMHRLGFEEGQIEPLIERLLRCDEVQVATLFTHLSCADEPTEDAFTEQQLDRFERMTSRLMEALPYRVRRHAAASAAMVRFGRAQYDLCRLGIGLYGYGWEAGQRPVSTLVTNIVQLKHIAPNEGVGYGREGRADQERLIATIPIGYADGLDRRLGNGRWSMLVGGVKAPIVGRVCMDSCMIDVTALGDRVREGDEVVIFSAEPGHTAQAMAEVLGTIAYEVLTSISARVKRVYIN